MSVDTRNISSETLKLFRECNLEQIRDYDLELSSRIDKARNHFREELRTHYQDILKVTDEVDHLHRQLKDGDALFMDLCFKDDLYQLTKLPDFSNESDYRCADSMTSLSSITQVSAKPVLAVSQWVLAITDLVSRYATSYSSSKLFDGVIQAFKELAVLGSSLEGYEDVIQSKCNVFLTFATSQAVTFTVEQRIQLYNLVTEVANSIFLWDSASVEKLERQTFDFILQEHLDETLKSDNELVASFVAAENFKQRLSNKLKHDISAQFKDLDNLLSAEGEELIKPDQPPLSTQHIQTLIQNSQYYCMGLVTDKKVQWHRTVVSLIDSIQKLEQYGGAPLGQELRKELIQKLEAGNTATPLQHEPLSMDDLVSTVVADFNTESLSQTIQTTMQSLTV